MPIYEFVVRVEHPNESMAEQHSALLRESVHAHAVVIHDMLNGTTTISPTRKIIVRKKRKVKDA